MGVAEGRGVQLVLPPGCNLLQQPRELYGYESHDADGHLVPAYQSRYVKKAVAAAPPGVCLPDGRAAIPAEIAEEVQRERELVPPPPGCLGPVGAA